MLAIRLASGGAELHKEYADLFIVLDGEATEVTGGTIGDPKYMGDEVNGTGIKGLASQPLHKGDTLLIPAKMPHPDETPSWHQLYLLRSQVSGTRGRLTAAPCFVARPITWRFCEDQTYG